MNPPAELLSLTRQNPLLSEPSCGTQFVLGLLHRRSISLATISATIRWSSGRSSDGNSIAEGSALGGSGEPSDSSCCVGLGARRRREATRRCSAKMFSARSYLGTSPSACSAFLVPSSPTSAGRSSPSTVADGSGVRSPTSAIAGTLSNGGMMSVALSTRVRLSLAL